MKKTTIDFKSTPNIETRGYAQVTGTIINDLLTSVSLIKANRQEEAKAILQGMSIAVKTLSAAAHTSREGAANASQVIEMQLEELEKSIGIIYQHEQDIEVAIRKIKETLEYDEKLEILTGKQQKQLVSEINGIRNKIAKLQETKKYMLALLVFGIAGVIAATTAISVENNKLNSKKEEWARLASEIQNNQKKMQDIRAEIDKSYREIADKKKEINSLEIVRGELEGQKKIVAARLVFLLTIEQFYGSLEVKLQNVDHRIEDVQDIVDSLQSEVVRPALEEGEKRLWLVLKTPLSDLQNMSIRVLRLLA